MAAMTPTPAGHAPWHTLVQKLSSSAPGSWVLAHGLRYLDRFVVWISRGRTSLTGILAGVPVVMVTTTGARSGRSRTSPLLPIWDREQAGRFALIASNWGQHHFPAWYFNLKKNPRSVCIISGQTAEYFAHEAAGDEYDRFWGYAVDMYFGYALYRQRAGRRIPILIMERAGEP